MLGVLNKVILVIVKKCFLFGIKKLFLKNCFFIMIIFGVKGSFVNFF